jgi:hypothetical protein
LAETLTITRLREGLELTLTATRLGVGSKLLQTVASTNPMWVLSYSPAGRCHPCRFLPWRTLTVNPIGAERLSLTRVVGSRHLHAATESLA